MSWIDWTVLLGTLLIIVIYGSWKPRKNNNLESYLKGNNSEGWMTIGLSIMATQASAITFLSTPGQAYESGMGDCTILLWITLGHDYHIGLLSSDILPH